MSQNFPTVNLMQIVSVTSQPHPRSAARSSAPIVLFCHYLRPSFDSSTYCAYSGVSMFKIHKLSMYHCLVCKVLILCTNLYKKSKHTFCGQQLFFFFENRGFWDNVEKYYRAGQATDDNITRRMCFACWTNTTTDTNTHSQYTILIAFPRQQWLRERTSMLCYTCFACLL